MSPEGDTPVSIMKVCIEEFEKVVDISPGRALELCGYIEYYAISQALAISEKWSLRTGR